VGYLERAQLMGHDVSRLKAGETIQSMVLVDTLDKFKAIFAAELTAEQRAEYSKKILALPSGVQFGGFREAPMMRLISYVFGDGELTAADAAFAKTLFPLKINAISGATITITTAVVYGPTAIPVTVNAGTLIFAGGSITAENTVLTVRADNLQINASPAATAKPYHVGILGVTPATAATGLTGTSTPGQAPAGTSAQPRSPGNCLGAPGGGNGSTGAPGGKGGPGEPGQPGLASYTATITIETYDSAPASFVVFTQSGGGGRGGQGGTGGQGQQGGTGGNGCDSGCEGTHSGDGGPGGPGGAGNMGGSGGGGIDGFPITINFPKVAQSHLVMTDATAPPGAGGAQGEGGAPGAGGNPGKAGKDSGTGAVGAIGAPGVRGERGLDSKTSGTPGHYTTHFL
jgi:hypothetical protein